MGVGFSFLVLISPLKAAGPAVVISEVAWMGTAASANHEWLELYNPSETAVDLTGWHLVAADGSPNIVLSGTIAGQSVYLLERTAETTINTVPAQLIYTGALGNSGESLILSDAGGNVVDQVDTWYAGTNTPKASMVRADTNVQGNRASAWVTSTTGMGAQDAAGNEILGSPGVFIPVPAGSDNEGPSPDDAQTQEPAEDSGTSGGGGTSGAVEIMVAVPNSKVPSALDQISLPVASDLTLTPKVTGLVVLRWSMGDGTSRADTQTFTYQYHYPGKYFVVLSGEGGDEAVSDQLEVFVYAGGVGISEFMPNPAGADAGQEWLEISNRGAYLIDLGGYKLEVGATTPKSYTLPSPTFLPAGGYLVIPLSQTNQTLGNEKGSAALFYPNGVAANKLVYENAPEDHSAVAYQESFVWSSTPTPGFANVVNPSQPQAENAGLAQVVEPSPQTQTLAIGGDDSKNVKDAALKNTVIPPTSFEAQTSDAYSSFSQLFGGAPEAATLPTPLLTSNADQNGEASGVKVGLNEDLTQVTFAATGQNPERSGRLMVLVASIIIAGAMLYYSVRRREIKS